MTRDGNLTLPWSVTKPTCVTLFIIHGFMVSSNMSSFIAGDFSKSLRMLWSEFGGF